jgi:tRNA pseudouridine55 synthase
MAKALDGIVLIDKTEGETSFNVVRRLRKILNIRKAGHAGTLDPFASGLLVMLLGQGTKLSAYLMGQRKSYRATVRLGIETDTMDPTGRVVRRRPVPALGPEDIRKTGRCFEGTVDQVPPAFSALKLDGKRAYALARQGIPVELKKRRVRIHSLDIVSVDLPEFTFLVTCSGGTYIRSLAADLGKALGCGGHLKALRRLSSGPFSVREALKLEEGGAALSQRALERRVIPLGDALPDMMGAQIDDRTARKIRNGYQPQWQDLQTVSSWPDAYRGEVKLMTGTTLVAILEARRDSGMPEGKFRVVRVFH